jgi:hypothetical protein
MKAFLLAAAFLLLASPAWAQFNACSQTVGATAAPVPFVAGTLPRSYFEICNAHATNTVGVNPSGGTAAIGAAGTRTLAPGACWVWKDSVPQVVSVIGSAVTTTTACQYQ